MHAYRWIMLACWSSLAAQYAWGQGPGTPTQVASANQQQVYGAQNQKTGYGSVQQPAGTSVPVAQQSAPAQGNVVGQAQQAANTAAGVAPNPPFPPLAPQLQQYLDQVLSVWQQETSKIERLRCEFNRFQYDPALNASGHYSVASGELKYMSPDKGLFRIDDLRFFVGMDANNKPMFEVNKRSEFGEYWICDGVYVQILDRNEKKCTKIELPPNMRGKQIYMSPLPFLFGVNAVEIKSRFWLQPLELPAGRNNEVWIEAWPKTSADAQNYSRVQVVLDASEVLPKGLIVFLPNSRPGAETKEIYDFVKREKNPISLNPFSQGFIPERLPKDWKVIVEPFQAQPPAQPAAPGAQPRVAQPPLNTPRR